MNLAIHDPGILQALHAARSTACWPRRRIVAWIPSAYQRTRPATVAPLLATGHLRLTAVAEPHAGFFEVFRERLPSGLTRREAELLFLADHSASVVLTTERLVAGVAGEIGLDVWAGDATSLDAVFPLQPPDVEPSPALPPAPAPIDRARVFLSNEFPTHRRVPDRVEPVPRDWQHTRTGRSGSLRPSRRAQLN